MTYSIVLGCDLRMSAPHRDKSDRIQANHILAICFYFGTLVYTTAHEIVRLKVFCIVNTTLQNMALGGLNITNL